MSKIKLALGYDTERPYGHLASTKKGREFRKIQLAFICKLSEFLDRARIPRTFFILGDYLYRCLEDFSAEKLRTIFPNNYLNEIQQHTYSHLIFRMIMGGEHKLIANIPEFLEDINRANVVLKDILNITPSGLRTPLGYHHDLSDLPELVKGLCDAGFNYISSDLRSENSIEGKLTCERQPHSYKHLGFPNLIEIPSHGWHDDIFTFEKAQKYLKKGPVEPEEVFRHYNSLFERAEDLSLSRTQPLYISLCLHPWAMMEYDPNLSIHKRLVDSAFEKDMEFLSYGKVAKETLDLEVEVQ